VPHFVAFDRLVGVSGPERAASFEAFAREHGRSLFGTAYLLCEDAASAEELVQDALVASFEQWDRVARAQSPVAYVRRSLVNRFVSAHRGPRSRVVLMGEMPEHALVRDIADMAVSREAARALLATLSARPRAVLVLKYLYDWPDVAIATAIGCRQATVRSMTRRSLIALRHVASSDIASAGAAQSDASIVRRSTDG
jgi:RNA polymerase sigma-70 factor (sigma-E family)